MLTLVAGPSAHESERTQVSLTLAGDDTFVLEVAHDPDWLLLRLERFAPGPDLVDRSSLSPAAGGSRSTLADRDTRLSELGEVFIDRVVLFVDGHEVRPQRAEYLPPDADVPTEAPPAGANGPSDLQSAPSVPLARFRLHGRMPAGAQTLRWYYGLVVDPYPLVLRRADGSTVMEWVLGDAWSTALGLSGPSQTRGRWQTAWQYFGIGYQHILPRGLDHILFVLGLFLFSRGLAPLLAQVTAFTIAHSITLALAVYGVVSWPSSIVEPLVALSIAYVGVENVLSRRLTSSRLAIVFAFGLMHGMGFAGVLRDLGLPRQEMVTGLLAFNVGVEAGQLSVVALAALCVWWWRERAWYHRRVVVPASLGIALVGAYWVAARL